MLTTYRLFLTSADLVDIYGIPTPEASEHWTPAERAQLADLMIAKWTAFKQAGVQPVDQTAALAANLAR
jgi:hypothetical protein